VFESNTIKYVILKNIYYISLIKVNIQYTRELNYRKCRKHDGKYVKCQIEMLNSLSFLRAFVSKDVGAIVLFSRRNNKNENQSNESEKLSQWRNQNERK